MVGACLGVVIKNPTNRFLGAIVGFSGGLMLSVVVFELIPEAISNWSFFGTLFFCVLGIGVIMVLDRMLIVAKWFSNTHMRVAFMAAMGLMVHNLPEGIIMGCGFLATQGLGIKMSIIISIHDIPEGMAVAAPLMANKTKISKILLYAFLAAFPTAIGVWIGAYLGSLSGDVLGGCLSFASGIMLYVVCGEMLPESSKLWNGITSTMGVLTGIVLGLVITRVI
ncbi:MAG: ZIP family metal transporter [Clostridiaceae bacterium]|nr:ZIP family metal transporter [Clostridiaceae bacterium]